MNSSEGMYALDCYEHANFLKFFEWNKYSLVQNDNVNLPGKRLKVTTFLFTNETKGCSEEYVYQNNEGFHCGHSQFCMHMAKEYQTVGSV